jgi:hypothetical protein
LEKFEKNSVLTRDRGERMEAFRKQGGEIKKSEALVEIISNFSPSD